MRNVYASMVTRNPRWYPLAAGVIALALSVPARGERIVYVSAAAQGADDGTSWTAAYTDLQDALDDVRNNGGCPCEIWIAQGVYKPDRGTGDRLLSYELVGDVVLYGGFAGWEECREDRNPQLYQTILNGDLNDDDDDELPPHGDQTCCRGNTPGCEDATCRTLVVEARGSCAINWDWGCANVAFGLCCHVCRPTRCDNTNYVVHAIGSETTVILDGLTVMRGEAYGIYGEDFGAGLRASDAAVTVRNCVFMRNGGAGGSGLDVRYGRLTLEDSLFVENFTQAAGWPVAWSEGDQAVIRGCAFVDNEGGGLLADGTQTIEDCKFLRNKAWGLTIFGVGQVLRCGFFSNGGGGMSSDGSAIVIDSRFIGNTSSGVVAYGGLRVENSLFAGNTSRFAAAILSGFGTATLINCTFVNNFANGAGSVWFGGGGVIRNCIFWNNRSDTSFGAGIGMLDYPHRTPDVRYSILQNETQFYPGVGVIDVDPLFVDPDGADFIAWKVDEDLRLLPGSPAINAGDSNTSYLPDTDLDGHARVLCDRVDIGAYEFGIGDYNCDQTIDLFDFANWSTCMTGPSTADTAVPQGCEAFDFNADQSIDLLDFAAFQTWFIGD